MSEQPVASYKCPWCGCDGVEGLLIPSHRLWACGSSKRGAAPVQSPTCRVYELEAEVARLRAEHAAAVAWADAHVAVGNALRAYRDGNGDWAAYDAALDAQDDAEAAYRAATKKGATE